MGQNFRKNILSVFIFLFSGTLAHASLGDLEQSIDNDQQALGFVSRKIEGHAASLKTALSKAPDFKVHILSSAKGELRQYVNKDGIVFALTWAGNSHPDLSQILGTYYSEYQNQMERAPRKPGRYPVLLQTPKMTLHQSGHMRSVQGKAYDPSLFPKNFVVENLQ